MWLQILGLPDGTPVWWRLSGSARSTGVELGRALDHQLPGHRFTVGDRPVTELGALPQTLEGPLVLIARPRTARTGPLQRPRDRRSGPEVTLYTQDGPDGGRLAPLSRSGLTIGRNHADLCVADPYLSAPHLRAAVGPEGVTVHPLGGGPALGGPDADPDGRLWDGRVPLPAGGSTFGLLRGRPVALPPLGTPPQLEVDPGPEPVRPNLVLQAVMAASPLLIGIVLVVVTGHWYFMLFALVSVAVAAVMYGQHRSARRRHGRRIEDLTAALAHELHRRAPGPAHLALATRAAAPDRFGVHVAAPPAPLIRWGAALTEVPLRSGAPGRRASDWSRWSRHRVPLLSLLRPGQRTRVTGEPSSLGPITRWVGAQLQRDALASGRAVVMLSHGRRTWLAGGPQSTEGTVLIAEPHGADATPGPLGAHEGLCDHWHQVVFTSGDRTGRAQPELTMSTSGPTGETLNLNTLDLDVGTALVDGVVYRDVGVQGIAASTARWLAAELGYAPRPPHSATAALTLPASPMRATAATSLVASLSASDPGADVDLVADGPHLLIAGTTGSGKSELLLTLLTGLTAGYPPAEVSLILLDFKGGSSFASLGRLPHTMSVETNLVESTSLRALDAIAAELRRREELFLSAAVPDYPTFRTRHPQQCLPRLVVAVDELRVLVEDHPQAATALGRLAATGRSLGFHLILSTQRAQGAVSSDIRSNLGAVICLRTATEQESWDLLGSAIAHAISAREPGRAYLQRAGSPPVGFRASGYVTASDRLCLNPWTAADSGTGPQPTPWRALVEELAAHAVTAGLPVPEPVVLPSLPNTYHPVADRTPSGAVELGLSDLPARRRRETVLWRPDRDGSVAWIGSETGGLRPAARALLAQLVETGQATPASPGSVPSPGSAPGPDRSSGATVPLLRVFDGDGWLGETPAPGTDRTDWSAWLHADWRLRPEETTAESLAAVLEELASGVQQRRVQRVVITHWARWAQLRVGGGFETFEERMTALARDHGSQGLAVAVFGGRELSVSRLLGHLPLRFYVPAGTTPEHRMVWPTLIRVPEVPGRAIMVSHAHPSPGVAVQLAEPRGSGIWTGPGQHQTTGSGPDHL